jgi:hypothetical protein
MPRQIRFILTLILTLQLLIPTCVFGCSQSDYGSNYITIESSLKQNVLSQESTCLDIWCNTKVTKLYENKETNSHKNDFKVTTKLDKPIEREIKGKNELIADHSFPIEIIEDKIYLYFISSERYPEREDSFEPSKVKDILWWMVNDNISDLDFKRFESKHPDKFPITTLSFLKYSDKKLKELQDQKNNRKGFECGYTEFEVKKDWIKTWIDYRKDCKTGQQSSIGCSVYVDPLDPDLEKKGLSYYPKSTQDLEAKIPQSIVKTDKTITQTQSFWFQNIYLIVVFVGVLGVIVSIGIYRSVNTKNIKTSQKE